MNILLTGFTGNLGTEIASQLISDHGIFALVRQPLVFPWTEGLTFVKGALESLPQELAGTIEGIVHGAALTSFKAPLDESRRTNVEGTAHVLAFAERCPHLRRFIHLSTACVCGDRGGLIPEEPLSAPANFLNAYEQSKWEAEQLVLTSPVPAEIVRLSIVAGSERDGSVLRLGALHHALHWFYKGLIPMMPGNPSSRVDLISTEFAAAVVANVLREEGQAGRILHGVAGEAAPTLAEIFECLHALFAQHHRGWAKGAIVLPDLVDAQTFAMFEASVRQSGNLLFQRVCDDAQTFLPGLLYPRTYAVSRAAEIPTTDWRALVHRVFAWLLATDWGRQTSTTRHAA